MSAWSARLLDNPGPHRRGNTMSTQLLTRPGKPAEHAPGLHRQRIGKVGNIGGQVWGGGASSPCRRVRLR